MGWLAVALLLLLGLVLLAMLLLWLAGPLRRVQAARASLLAALAAGSDRLRGGVARLTSWRDARRDAGDTDADA